MMKTHLITLCLLLAVTVAHAQEQQWKHYTNSTTPSCMIADGQYLWIGTNAGLVKFDRTTKHYEVFHTSTSGLQMNAIMSLARDQEGAIWAGTRGGGIARLKNGKWTQFTRQDYSFGSGVIWTMAADSVGNMWFGGDGGLARYKDGNFTYFTKDNAPFAENWIYAVVADRKGGIWVTTRTNNSIPVDRASVLHFNGVSWELHSEPLDEDFPELRNFFSIYPARNGEVWFGLEGNVARLNERSWKMFSSAPGGGAYFYVYGLGEDQYGTMHMTTPWGMSAFDGDEWMVDTTYPLQNGKAIVSIDDEMWFAGYEGGGIARRKDSVWEAFTDLSTSGIIKNSLESMTIDANGTRWFAFAEREVVSFDGQSWKTHHFLDATLDRVFALAADSSGNLWLGTSMNGIVKWDGSAATRYRRANSPMITDKVMAIAYDKHRDAIWFGGRFDQKSDSTQKGALTYFDGTNWRNFYPANSGLPWSEINDIDIAPNGHVWVGMPYMGVAVYDGINNWTAYNKSNSGIPDDFANGLAITNDGVVWLATNEGAGRFQDGEWKSFTSQSDGLANNGLTDVAIDTSGDVWFSAYGTPNGGLIRYSKGEWINYGIFNSPVGSMLVNTIMTDRRGNVYGGTIDAGVVVFNENGIDGVSSVPKISRVSDLEAYPNPATSRVSLRVPPDARMIRITDVLGRERLTRIPTQELETLDVHALEPGIYIIVIETESGATSKPLLISR